MIRPEILAARERAQAELTSATALLDRTEMALATVHPTHPSTFFYREAHRLAGIAVEQARTRLAHYTDALAAMDTLTAVGPQSIQAEALEVPVVETVRYASIVVGIGRNPDNPEQMKCQAVRRSHQPEICGRQAASVLRKLADDLDDAANCNPTEH